MIFDAYTTAALQLAYTILTQAATMTRTETMAMLDAEIQSRTQVSAVVSVYPACPSEGCSGRLEPWPKTSREVGAPVVGCLLCRYSQVVK